jgi:hypothetical protein
MDIDSDSHAEGASPIECGTEILDEAGKLYAKHFLIQQWMLRGEDDVPPSRCQSPENLCPPRSAGSPPALDSADERDCGVTYDRSSSLVVRVPEENCTPIPTEEMNSEQSMEIVVSPHNALSPSPIPGLSAQTQKASLPSHIGQKSGFISLPTEVLFDIVREAECLPERSFLALSW